MDPSARPAALQQDTLVYTGRGLVPISDIQPGESVFSLDERTREVSATTVRARLQCGLSDILEIRVGTRTIRTTAEVRFLALIDRRRPGRIRRRYRREWTRAGDLKVGDIVAVARKTPDLGTVQQLPLPTKVRDRRARSVILPAMATDDLLWWLGLYTGDGYVHNSGLHKRVEFAVPATQLDLREELIRVSWYIFGVQARAKDEWRVVVPGIRLVDYVEAIGLRGTALEKRIPAWVFSSPETHRLSFLGGYVDADGSIRTPAGRGHNKDMGLTSGNAELLEDARRLAVTCGIRTSTIWDFRSRHPFDDARWITGYRMQFSGDFDRIACRAAHRIARMKKRKFFHNNTCVRGTTLRSHTSEWLGFARIEQITASEAADTWAVFVDRAASIVAEGLVVAAGSRQGGQVGQGNPGGESARQLPVRGPSGRGLDFRPKR